MPLQSEASAKGKLYVVATPIGNLGDITLRAIDVLKNADVVAAEDTRTTGLLLKNFAISKKMLSLRQHNEREASEKIVFLLAQGKHVAYVSDAGTPAISDPGAILVSRVKEAGFDAIPIPGANAAIAALSVSGLEDTGFLFCGFLPAKASARKQALERLKDCPYTLVFYEAPHRIVDFCKAVLEAYGENRKMVLAREITKVFETIHACRAGDAPSWLESDSNRRKGEFVVLVEGAALKETGLAEGAQKTLEILLRSLPLKQAVKLASEISGENKNRLYELALELKDMSKENK